jgi:hypothetical protein
MRLILPLIALLLSTLAAPALAQEGACKSAGAMEADIRAGLKPGMQMEAPVSYAGDQAITLTDAFNSVPPATDNKADQVIVYGFVHPTGDPSPAVLMVLFLDGCMQAGGAAQRSYLEQLLHAGDA